MRDSKSITLESSAVKKIKFWDTCSRALILILYAGWFILEVNVGISDTIYMLCSAIFLGSFVCYNIIFHRLYLQVNLAPFALTSRIVMIVLATALFGYMYFFQ